jgi:putative PEP-CTERM system histidine kinase
VSLFAVCYGIGCLSFLTLIGLMLLRQRPTGFGLRVVAVYALTALWAFGAAVQPWWAPGIVHVLDGIRNAAWLEFLALVFVDASNKDKTHVSPVYTVIVPLVCLLTAANDFRFVTSATSPIDFSASQVICRILVSICGILIVENLFRNTLPARRWHMLPLCIAAGSLFAYDLFVFADAVIFRHADPVLFAGRGIVLAFVVPALVVTMARNQSWNIDIHVSRRVVFHTATLSIGGIFLIIAAGIAGFVGRLSGDWGALLRLMFFGGSVLAITTVLSISSLRSRLWRTLFENFFSARYDYRAEWMRCIATLSSSGDRDPLQTRVIRAVADVVDSPGGILWLKDADGIFRIKASTNINLDPSLVEPEDGPFVKAFDKGNTVQVFERPTASTPLPDWVRDNARVWLAVPLVLSEEIVGFIVLAQPRAPLTLNWESFDLLIAVGRQSASWLLEDLSARALAESQALFEYSKRFSFVAHDVKNVSSQLGIMIANMKNFGDQPEFRVDMVRTMEASIGRLKGLLDKLRADEGSRLQIGKTNVAAVVASVTQDLNNQAVNVEQDGQSTDCETITEADLRSVLTHVITNAIEASQPGDPVVVSLQANEKQTTIVVRDKGCGMDAEFIKNELFVPMRSTKQSGHGVGAYQSRELVRAAGGALDVTSSVGEGTLVRIVLPRNTLSSRSAACDKAV